MKAILLRVLGTCLAALVVIALVYNNAFAQMADFRKMTPIQRSAFFAKMFAGARKDREKMMAELHIKVPDNLPPDSTDPNRPNHLTQRPGSSNWYDDTGNIYVRSEWGNWSNYTESKAGGYILPDPLKLNNGRMVTRAADWRKYRRPEILHDFQIDVYGQIPRHPPKVNFQVIHTDSQALGGLAIQRNVVGHIDNSGFPAARPSIPFTLYLPAAARKPVPLMVIVWGGFPAPLGTIREILDTGWAVAIVNTGAIQQDNGSGLDAGIIGLVNKGKSRKPDDWGVLAAWSWGLSRTLDYFEKDKSINPKEIGIQGHSRWGKAAILAGAMDRRWAMVFSSCAGAMGTSLEKRSWGETIDNVAGTQEYHWMAGNFLRYAGHWKDMPVDAHELIALVAPRPVFITGGTQDQWSDPHGEFLACMGANPVYRLLGVKGLGTTIMPAPNVSLVSGNLAFREHAGGHTDVPDWPVFLHFAHRYFRKKGSKHENR